MAFDLFRKAQLLRVQGKGSDAQQLRDRAYQMFSRVFGGDFAVFHIDLEEARESLEMGEIRPPRIKAEGALEGWAQINYAKGMADALQVLGTSEIMKGHPKLALELYVASLCIYPFENHQANRQLWAEIEFLCSDIIRWEGRKEYVNLIQSIQELIENRQSYFYHLNNVYADRRTEIERILSKLRSQ